MNTKLTVVESSTPYKVLSDAARYQFGYHTFVPVWLSELSPHGTSYHGYDFFKERWLQVNLDNKLTPQ